AASHRVGEWDESCDEAEGPDEPAGFRRSRHVENAADEHRAEDEDRQQPFPAPTHVRPKRLRPLAKDAHPGRVHRSGCGWIKTGPSKVFSTFAETLPTITLRTTPSPRCPIATSADRPPSSAASRMACVGSAET